MTGGADIYVSCSQTMFDIIGKDISLLSDSVTKFASGNARVALALANTIESGESVASLKDADLFERLFRQRHESSNSLLLSAQACSLAYSFQGEDLTTGKDAAISKLATVVGKEVRSLRADIAELRRRDLLATTWRLESPPASRNYESFGGHGA
jgi:hypothetical protein